VLRYDAADAALVSDYVRTHVSLEASADALEALARQVIEAEPGRAVIDPRDELREFARHVADNLVPFGTPQVAVQVGLLLARIQDLESRLIGTATSLANTQEDLLASGARAMELEQQAQALSGLSDRAAWLERQVQELQDARTQADAFEREVQALRNSHSWRLTAPMRWLVSRFKH
jgi:hypothetical protein